MPTSKHLLLVTYTLYPPEADLEKIVAMLERADSYEVDETCWLVYTEESARWWYSQLEQFLFEDDELTVLQIQIEDFGMDEGLREDMQRWLETRPLS
jgi:hypothetical protein